MSTMAPGPMSRVLDVGGAQGRYFSQMYPWPGRVTVLDTLLTSLRQVTGSEAVQGSALQLPFCDEAFDFVWSNAVIEHVGDLSLQKRFAAEVRRVGLGYFVSTPWKGFPIELHYKLPLYQFVPKRIQRALASRFAIGWYAKGEWDDVHLLWGRQLRTLFPDAHVMLHRVTPWPETVIAYRLPVRWSGQPSKTAGSEWARAATD